jgi:hypothetical protein
MPTKVLTDGGGLVGGGGGAVSSTHLIFGFDFEFFTISLLVMSKY